MIHQIPESEIPNQLLSASREIKRLNEIIVDLISEKLKGEMVKGRVWSGFIGECKGDKRTPCYIIPEPDEEGIFLCDILKKYAKQEVVITIDHIADKLE